MMSAVYFVLLVVFVSRHDVMGDRLGQLCLDAEAVGTSETLRQICQEYYQNSDGGPSNEYGSKFNTIRSPVYAADVDGSVYDGDKSNEQLLRRTLLALLPSRSAYLRQIIAAGDRSGGIDDDNKSDKRDGNYIRFGKKQHSQFKRTAPIVRSYLASFGARDKKPDGQYMRFGRSVAPLNANDSASRATGETKNSSKDAAKSPDRKRFMRFGRSSAAQEKEKRFMRFGRAHGKIDESGVEDDDQSRGNEPPVDALFFRFGRNFMRFGRAHASPDTDSKRQEAPVAIGARQQKRFMRFGRAPAQKRFMRFGKSMPNAVAADGAEYDADKQLASQMQPEKRFMRFGKRTDAAAIGDSSLNPAHKRFMRFGKRTLVIGAGTPKRFMRFGRSSDRPAAKRLWKKTSGGTAD